MTAFDDLTQAEQISKLQMAVRHLWASNCEYHCPRGDCSLPGDPTYEQDHTYECRSAWRLLDGLDE